MEFSGRREVVRPNINANLQELAFDAEVDAEHGIVSAKDAITQSYGKVDILSSIHNTLRNGSGSHRQ
jgi:hypothetical protein